MVVPHGKGTNILADGDDLTTFLNAYSTTRGVDASITTTFGVDDHTYIAGIESGSISLGGYFDGAASAVHEALGAHFGADNSPVISVFPDSYDAIGNNAIMLGGKLTQYDIDSSVTDAVGISAGATADGGLRNGGTVIHALAARTTTFDGASNDELALSTFGGAAHLHVTALTGTDADIVLQHSVDDGVWVDLADWTGTAAVGGTRNVVTGTVNRWLRARITGGTFSSVTFAVCFARNKR